jgi:hypothetical protein
MESPEGPSNVEELQREAMELARALTSSLMEKGSLEEMVLGPQPSLWRGSSKF